MEKTRRMMAGIVLAAVAASACAEDAIFFRVPPRGGPIAVDGRLEEETWRDAVVINASALVGGTLYPRDAAWLLLWDADALYLANRSQLRENERIVRERRTPEEIPDIVFDDSVELVLDPPGGGESNPRYQVLMNTMGLAQCIRQITVPRPGARDPQSDPASQKTFMDWTAGWESAFAVTEDGRRLVGEIRVPVASMKAGPNRAGDRWGAVLSRNYKNPWAQASVGGRNGFTLPASMARFVLVDDAPVAGIGDIALDPSGALALRIPYAAATESRIGGTLALTLRRGKETLVEERLACPAVGPGQSGMRRYETSLSAEEGARYRLEFAVTLGDATALRYACGLTPGFATDAVAPFPPDRPYPVIIKPNPFRGTCLLRADLIDIPKRHAVTALAWSVRHAEGETVASGSLGDPAYEVIEGTVAMGRLLPGAYVFRTELRTREGAVLQADERAFRRGATETLACDIVPGETERIVFLGDSITEAHRYPLYIELYLRTRFPKRRWFFRNVGIGGDTATLRMRGGWPALFEDVLAFRPTLTTIMFGMNDRGHPAHRERSLRIFEEAMRFNIETLRNGGTRLAVLASSPINRFDTEGWDGAEENRTLFAMRDRLAAYCEAEGLPFVDFTRPLFALFRKDPRYTGQGDPIHPGPAANLAMAGRVLEAMGVEGFASNVRIDAEQKKVMTAEGCRVTRLECTDDSVRFVRHDERYPLYVPEACRLTVEHVPLLERFSPYTLRVEGLAAGIYSVRVGGETAGTVSAENLAAGVNATLWANTGEGPLAALAEELRQLHELRVYLWKRYRRGWTPRAPRVEGWSDPGEDVLAASIEKREEALAERVRSAPRRWELIRVPDAGEEDAP